MPIDSYVLVKRIQMAKVLAVVSAARCISYSVVDDAPLRTG
jgi:hypothetical protein